MNDALALPRTKDMTRIIIKSNHLTVISEAVKLIDPQLYMHYIYIANIHSLFYIYAHDNQGF